MSNGSDNVGDRSTVADCDRVIAAQSAQATEAVKIQASAGAAKKNVEGQNSKASSEAAGARKTAESSGTANETLNGAVLEKVAAEATCLGGVIEGVSMIGEVLKDTSNQVTGMGLEGGVDMFDASAGAGVQTSHTTDFIFNTKNVSSSLTGETSSADESDLKITGAQADVGAVASLHKQCTIGIQMSHDAQQKIGNAYAKKAELGAENRQSQQMGMAPGANGMGGNTANINRAPHLALDEMKPKGPSKEMMEENGAA